MNLSYDYKSPFRITNAIIEVDTKAKYCISTLIKLLANVGCHEIEIRILNYDALLLTLEILKEFQASSIRSFYLNYQSEVKINIPSLEEKLNSNLKINQLKVFNSKNNLVDSQSKIVRIKRPYIEDSSFTSLIINATYFYESQHFNASLNQKITIDKNGNIKNYINHKEIFGNINYQTIEGIIRNKEFTKIWNITNDKIEICKDCQYRYFCLNFSELEEKNGKFYKRNYCNKLFLN